MQTASTIACVAAALLIAGSAAAQPGPPKTSRTPGTTGAMTAVTELLDAQRAGDWRTVAARLDPALVTELGTYTRDLSARSRAALADPSVQGLAEDLARFNRIARRIARLVPPDSALTDAQVVARVFEADAARPTAALAVARRTSRGWAQGFPESDSLVHVFVSWSDAPLPASDAVRPLADYPVTARWADGRWSVATSGRTDSPHFEYLRFATHNWAEVLGRIAEDGADLSTGAMEGDE